MHRCSFVFTLFAAIVVLGMIAVHAQDKPARASRAPKTAATAAAPVDLNTATAAQIATLPGVGPKAAQRIVEYRDKNGGFKKIEELMNVKGIGEKSFLKLKPLITVGEKAPARQ
jgi:competence protein ComEA